MKSKRWGTPTLLLLVLLLKYAAGEASDDYKFSTSTLSFEDWAGRCSEDSLEWLRSYAAFHKANRRAPDAKYLVYVCAGKQTCMGFGECRDAHLLILRRMGPQRACMTGSWPMHTPSSVRLERACMAGTDH